MISSTLVYIVSRHGLNMTMSLSYILVNISRHSLNTTLSINKYYIIFLGQSLKMILSIFVCGIISQIVYTNIFTQREVHSYCLYDLY